MATDQRNSSKRSNITSYKYWIDMDLMKLSVKGSDDPFPFSPTDNLLLFATECIIVLVKYQRLSHVNEDYLLT